MNVFKNLFNKSKENIKNADSSMENMDDISNNFAETDEKISVYSKYTAEQESTEVQGTIEEEPIFIDEINIPKEIDNSYEESLQINPEIDQETKKESLLGKIFSGLDKTRKNILDSVENVLKTFSTIDEELFEELEEVLIWADIGVETSTKIINGVKDRVRKEKVTNTNDVKKLIIDEITDILTDESQELKITSPAIILVIGVNGVGKTTTIGKLAYNLKSEGKNVILAAADTFRAAAIDQLEIWGKRNDIPVIKHQENSDPAAVVFDGIKAAKARKTDILICDTAGRLHNKKNLMEELKKIKKIIEREYEEAQKEVFLVLDATTGQNALQQVRLFKEAADITGIILTKLDGTAKGGIVIAIKNELDVPVRYIGVGEKITDLQPFDAKVFANALFGIEDPQ